MTLRPYRFFLLAALLVVLFLADLALGSVSIPFGDVVTSLLSGAGSNMWADIIWHFRLPKSVTCVLAGSALATGGLLMQTLFRNPLAGPDVLGLTSGASLMVAVVILAGTSSGTLVAVSASPWSVAGAASAGSAIVFLLIMMIARRVRSNVSLLIIGLMISAGTASFVSVLQFISQADNLQAYVIWTMGSVGGTNWPEIEVLAIVVIIGLCLSLASMKSLNAWLLGENYARSIGINSQRSRFWLVLATSLMTGAVTAFCGPIAFVGLAVPHLVKPLVNTTNHKVLLPLVMMGGAALLLLCDILVQLPGQTQILPLNAITSLIGAPVVIWVVMRNRGGH